MEVKRWRENIERFMAGDMKMKHTKGSCVSVLVCDCKTATITLSLRFHTDLCRCTVRCFLLVSDMQDSTVVFLLWAYTVICTLGQCTEYERWVKLGLKLLYFSFHLTTYSTVLCPVK